MEESRPTSPTREKALRLRQTYRTTLRLITELESSCSHKRIEHRLRSVSNMIAAIMGDTEESGSSRQAEQTTCYDCMKFIHFGLIPPAGPNGEVIEKTWIEEREI